MRAMSITTTDPSTRNRGRNKRSFLSATLWIERKSLSVIRECLNDTMDCDSVNSQGWSMGWLHHDAGWWGIVLSITAIVLAIPLSIVGNLVTPTISNWWASRSEQSAKLRRDVLKDQLAYYETTFPSLGATEDQTLAGIEGLGSILILAFDCIGILMIMVAAYFQKRQIFTSWHEHFIFVIVPAGLSAFGVWSSLTIWKSKLVPLRVYRYERSPMVREQLKKSIEQLGKRAIR